MTKAFWNKEYANPKHLTMSVEPASDFETFERWAIRNAEWHPFPKDGLVLDIGTGNGRNLIYACAEHDMKGVGLDISGVAIEQAEKVAEKKLTKSGKKLDVKFEVRSASDPLPADDQSVDVVIDMMTTHFLRTAEREKLMQELLRVMKPYGWLIFKTFVLDGDFHAKRLIAEHPDPEGEENSYIHPRIGVFEHVFTEDEIFELFSPHFKIHKMIKSYKHFRDGKPYKRRTISVYLERNREE